MKAGDGQAVHVSGEAGIGKPRLAAALLERVLGDYGWFTEGFETPDLIEARLLLERLNRERGQLTCAFAITC